MSTGAAVLVSVPVVHAVTSDEVIAAPDFLGRARRVMQALGPRGALHLRAARGSGARLYALAVLLDEAQRESGCVVAGRPGNGWGAAGDAPPRGFAAIRGIWDAENAERAASAYLSSHDGHG